MTDELYDELSMAIQNAGTKADLDAVRPRVRRILESDHRRWALGEQMALKAADLGLIPSREQRQQQ